MKTLTFPATHFLLLNRHLKSLIRGENPLYKSTDIKCIAEHINNTRTRVDMIGANIDYEQNAKTILTKTQKRLGRDLQVYDLKVYIRNSVEAKKKLPICMIDAIAFKIENSPVYTWSWAIGVILFGKDKGLKDILKRKIVDEKTFSPIKVIHMLENTQILAGQPKIFSLLEQETLDNYKLVLSLYGEKIASYQMSVGKLGTMNDIKNKIRTKVIEKVFKYFE